jgi:phosphopantothenoylcysteine synthetase/decarboxylase
MQLDLAYLIVTCTTTAALAPDLVRMLLPLKGLVVTILTPNARQVVAPRELSTIDGNTVVESYFDTAILPRPPLGLVLVAPCSFNSLNKLAAGIADNLALSVTAEAIGRATPVLVAPSLNAPLLAHPRARAAMQTLRSWNVEVIDPVDPGDGRGRAWRPSSRLQTRHEHAGTLKAERQAADAQRIWALWASYAFQSARPSWVISA